MAWTYDGNEYSTPFVIDGTAVATPAVGGLVITDEPIWSSNTGRGSTGKMAGDIVAWKTTIEVTWPPLTFSQAHTLRDAIKNAGEFFDIYYTNFTTTNELVKKTVYASNIPRQLYSLTNKNRKYVGIVVTFVEQ